LLESATTKIRLVHTLAMGRPTLKKDRILKNKDLTKLILKTKDLIGLILKRKGLARTTSIAEDGAESTKGSAFGWPMMTLSFALLFQDSRLGKFRCILQELYCP